MIKGEICLPAGTVEFQCHDLALKMTRFDILRWNSRFQQACGWLTIDVYPHFLDPLVAGCHKMAFLIQPPCFATQSKPMPMWLDPLTMVSLDQTACQRGALTLNAEFRPIER